jgi:hypothetical protein
MSLKMSRRSPQRRYSEEALMYQPTKDAIALPTYSFNGPDNWTEIDPPLSAMPEF